MPPSETVRAVLDGAAQWVVNPTDAQKAVVAAAAAKVAAVSPEGELGRAVAKATPDAASSREEVVLAVLAVIERSTEKFASREDRDAFGAFVAGAARAVAEGRALWHSREPVAPSAPRNLDSWLQASNASDSPEDE